jgi:hypothetical protein
MNKFELSKNLFDEKIKFLKKELITTKEKPMKICNYIVYIKLTDNEPISEECFEKTVFDKKNNFNNNLIQYDKNIKIFRSGVIHMTGLKSLVEIENKYNEIKDIVGKYQEVLSFDIKRIDVVNIVSSGNFGFQIDCDLIYENQELKDNFTIINNNRNITIKNDTYKVNVFKSGSYIFFCKSFDTLSLLNDFKQYFNSDKVGLRRFVF